MGKGTQAGNQVNSPSIALGPVAVRLTHMLLWLFLWGARMLLGS
jgi:hypothetical protein